jgi:hypothetical protein
MPPAATAAAPKPPELPDHINLGFDMFYPYRVVPNGAKREMPRNDGSRLKSTMP